MLTLKEQLQTFLEQDGLNKWIRDNKMEIYLRAGPRILSTPEGVFKYRTLDIATVVVDPEYQKKGHFTFFLENAEEVAADASFECIYIENIINEPFLNFLLREKYRRVLSDGLACVFKCLI